MIDGAKIHKVFFSDNFFRENRSKVFLFGKDFRERLYIFDHCRKYSHSRKLKIILVFFSFNRIFDYRRTYSRLRKLKFYLVFFSLNRIFAA